jgi:hypothetical protein
MSNIRLSHSASSRYQECGKSYFYHYVKNYRPVVQSSPLLFGTAIYKAGEHYALTRDFHTTLELFLATWTHQEINGVNTDLRFLLNFTYSNRDLDLDLLKKEDWEELIDTTCEEHGGEVQEAIDRKDKVGYKNLTDNEKRIFNFANWLCLKRKGQYMLLEFKHIVDKNVEEVLGTQVKVDLENESGDAVVGFVDFVFKWKGIEKPVIFDLKTSGIEYDEDAVVKSPQLGLYVFSLSEKYANTKHAGFIVLNKNISKNKTKICLSCGKDGSGGRFKTCDAIISTDAKGKGIRCDGTWEETLNPEARSQILVDSISELFVDRVVENFTEVNKAIKAEVFPRCFQSCIRFNGAVRCSFYDLCHNNSMEDLEIKEKV